MLLRFAASGSTRAEHLVIQRCVKPPSPVCPPASSNASVSPPFQSHVPAPCSQLKHPSIQTKPPALPAHTTPGRGSLPGSAAPINTSNTFHQYSSLTPSFLLGLGTVLVLVGETSGSTVPPVGPPHRGPAHSPPPRLVPPLRSGTQLPNDGSRPGMSSSVGTASS